ncbi:MAG: hypothetical protein HYX42_13255 [Polaromonas sp.]|uniref:hypothetical protein n=1 Tax=Polaromonas sp. TaxID=1869339 RepID=UPI0025D1E40C|nr:hypothetical protein [Polaromonas sp.]MBI2727205.1 hypothetical protein [Polaromonas sp.]
MANVFYALGKRPEAETVDSVRSIATLAAARISKLRRVHATHNDDPGRFASTVLWGGSHPIIFAALVGLGCAILALACLPAPYPDWAVIPFPDLPKDYTHTTFFGTIWSVQATLIALVYPIVLTFVPILLQRRASSKFALTFYMRDSAVLPAGTSSLLFLLVLTVQYLAAYYVPQELFLFGAVFDGLWLLANIGMTGYFLVKTVRYVEEDVGEATYRRLALSYILWADLEEAQTAALYDAGGPNIGEYRGGKLEPLVRMMAIHSGQPTVSTTLSGRNELVDIDLFLVNRVARAWATRAKGHVVGQGAERRPPTLELLPSFWGEYSGLVHIARVTGGPDLTPYERRDLLQAYVFAPQPSRFFTGNTKGLLEELASEVQSQLEQGRFDEAAMAFKKLRRLHEAFLHCSNTDQHSNLASVPATWSLGYRSVSDYWLDPYRPLFEVAANKLSANQGLWRDLCRLPAELVRRSNPQDVQMTDDILEQYELIDHFLGTWWTREAHRSQAVFGATGAQLPEPMASDYRDAITAVVNGLNVAAVPFDEKGAEDEHRWAARLRATVTWMTHADMCVRLLIGAVRRGDKVASEWYSDCLSHWLSDRAYEYGSRRFAYADDLPAANVRELDISWSKARQQVSAAIQGEATVDDAVHVLWASLKRHWEVARFTSALLLLRDEVHGTFQELAQRVAGHVLTLTFFTPGPSVDAQSLLDPDLLLSTYLRLCCFEPHSRAHSASLVARILRRGTDGPVINGWTYTGHGYQSNPESQAKQFMALLLASTDPGRFALNDASRLCRDLHELDTMRELSRVLALLIAEVKRPLRKGLPIAAAALRARFGSPTRTVSPLLQWRRKLKNLLEGVDAQIDAELRKIVVPPDAARTLVARLQAELLNPTDGKAWNGHMRTGAGAVTRSQDMWSESWRRYEKATFLRPHEEEFRQADVQCWARQIAWGTLPLALREALQIKGIKPIEGSSGGEQLLNLAAAIRVELRSGGSLVVLVPHGPSGRVAEEMHWQVDGRSGPPHGVEFTTRVGTEGPFAHRMVNGAFVFDMQTPDDRIYLVPAAWFDCLVFEQQLDGTILQHEFQVEEPDSVLFKLHWRAELSGAFHQT